MELGRATYNSEYAKKYLSTASYTYTRLKVARAAELITCDGSTGKTVLDVGGNINAVIKNGQRGVLEARDPTINYYALDISSAYFRVGDLRKTNDIIEYYKDGKGITADAHYLPMGNARVDTVILADVLEHLNDPFRVLHEVKRVLRPNGELILTLPAIYKLDILKNRRPDIAIAIGKRRDTSHVNFFDIPEVLKLVEDVGFQTTLLEGLDYGVGFPYLTWLVPEYVNSPHDQGENPRSKQFKAIKKELDSLDIAVHAELDTIMNHGGVAEVMRRNVSSDSCHPLHIIHDYLTLHPGFGSNYGNLHCVHDSVKDKVNQIKHEFAPIMIANALSTACESGPASLEGSFTIVAKKR
ncbi:MAG: class I SAM-dependent methyltransferase [bacterium]|nr:class I SAM-dependent methyltransferase [bacterium]